MALSYEALSQRRSNIEQRCVIAVLKYAVFIQNEAGNTTNHANRLNWSNIAMASPDNEARIASAFVLGDQQFLDGDLALSDSALQSIVETAINNKRISPP